jgi:hypothetical protein
MFGRRSVKWWLLGALGVPFASKAAIRAAQELRTRRGPSTAADRLEQAGQMLQRLAQRRLR